ncbi:MAG: hypothetical protein K2G44_04540 [Clostridia bacterium]|nr:hypothetical protein [Clostridia bacterium]
MKIKKLIPVMMALCVGTAVFSGCGSYSKEYAELNAKLDLNYSQVVLTVTNDFGEGAVLTSEYTMKFSDGSMTVNYGIERFSELSIDSTAPAKTKLVGEAVIADGKVSYVQGEEANLDVVKSGVGINFKESYFKNVELTGMYLKADIKNPSGFMGSELSCTEMKVYATFLEIFYKIEITYRAETGNFVEYLYVFSL